MDPFVFSLSLGAAGLGVMSLGGLAGHGHHGHSHGGGHDASDVSLAPGGAHGHGGVHGAAGAAHAPPAAGAVLPHGARLGAARHAAAHHAGGRGARDRATGALWALLSPRVLFSVLVGFGATGLLLRGVLGGGALTFAAAAAGAVAFEALLVRPLWNLAFRFASAPALTLESALLDEARAVSRFDANGQGLIAVEVDGQIVQVLGTLLAADRAAGVRVRAGDRLRIEEVDDARGRCTVTPAES
ncbi:MAG: hypothetical protein ACJ79S_16425 [Gemmatimonadaceae bacterium]